MMTPPSFVLAISRPMPCSVLFIVVLMTCFDDVVPTVAGILTGVVFFTGATGVRCGVNVGESRNSRDLHTTEMSQIHKPDAATKDDEIWLWIGSAKY